MLSETTRTTIGSYFDAEVDNVGELASDIKKNPEAPWAKSFLREFSALVKDRTMTIKEWENLTNQAVDSPEELQSVLQGYWDYLCEQLDVDKDAP